MGKIIQLVFGLLVLSILAGFIGLMIIDPPVTQQEVVKVIPSDRF